MATQTLGFGTDAEILNIIQVPDHDLNECKNCTYIINVVATICIHRYYRAASFLANKIGNNNALRERCFGGCCLYDWPEGALLFIRNDEDVVELLKAMVARDRFPQQMKDMVNARFFRTLRQMAETRDHRYLGRESTDTTLWLRCRTAAALRFLSTIRQQPASLGHMQMAEVEDHALIYIPDVLKIVQEYVVGASAKRQRLKGRRRTSRKRRPSSKRKTHQPK